MADYFDLGVYQRSITTSSSSALVWFNRGLVWCYGFNHDEAIRCFQQVIDLDSGCAMGYWGIAYATGPHYNKTWDQYGEQERLRVIPFCHEYAQKAKALKQQVSAVEQGLIDAMCLKHPVSQISSESDMNQWMQDYAEAMGLLYQKFPNDQDVICLYAEALMNLTPWKLWNLQKGVPAKNAATVKAIKVLDYGIKIAQSNSQKPHPGMIHFYIHAYEMSPTPEVALPAANLLRDLVPDSGHLLHMASHIDGICGHWQDAVDANTRAIATDRLYMEKHGRNGFYMISIVHNYDFKIWACMYLGLFEKALAAADSICDLTRDKIIPRDERFLNAALEGYHAKRAHVLIRFGKWQQICDEDMPDDVQLFQITAIYMVYAKAIAFATLGNLATAREFQQRFRDDYQKVPDWHQIHNNPTRSVLAVAEAMMDGEVEYHAGNHEVGFEHLRRANELSDNLNYSEPWAWMHPPRHALGALLLEQGQVDEALIHYEDDLGIGNRLPRCVQHPDNIWALHGYHECLTRLQREKDAASIKPKMDQLIRNADVTISSSCLCRKN